MISDLPMNGRTADEAKSTSISNRAFTSALERATSLRPFSQRVSESDKSADSGGTGQDRSAVCQYGTKFEQIINVVGANGRTVPVIIRPYGYGVGMES
jgi:hypothetical protein